MIYRLHRYHTIQCERGLIVKIVLHNSVDVRIYDWGYLLSERFSIINTRYTIL